LAGCAVCSADAAAIARLSAAFGLLAALLACVGLYGIMAYAVARRTNEIGIRMALGAQSGHVRWMVLRETLALVGAGMLLGIPAAWAGSRLISSQLFGLTAADPLTFAGALLLLAGAGALAGYLPARRAARVNPLVAIRYN
jgi:ABC-type antimicrobial peptide transport system permease subunit